MAIAGRSAGGRPLRRRREMMLTSAKPRVRGTTDVLSVVKVNFLQMSCSLGLFEL